MSIDHVSPDRAAAHQRWQALLLAVLLLLATGRGAFAALPLALTPLFTRLDGPVSVPAEITNRAFFVAVTINGTGPYRMLVDTGCSGTLISPAVAAAINPPQLADSETLWATNALGDTSPLPQVVLASLDCGAARFEGLTAGVTSFDLQSRAFGFRIDGTLGYSQFADLFVTLDFTHRRLLLSRDWPQDLPPVRAVLDVTEDDAVPRTTVRFQDRTADVIVDTGANDALKLTSSLAPALTWKTSPRPGPLTGAIGGVSRDWLGRLTGTLTVGATRQDEPVVSLSRGSPLLGLGYLHAFTLVFQPGGGKVWLCSDGDASLAAPSPRSVGLSLLADDGGWRVAGIIPGTPAESARIAPGDLVTQIEHRAARDWTRGDLQAWIDTHDTLAVTVGGTRALVLSVWSLVP